MPLITKPLFCYFCECHNENKLRTIVPPKYIFLGYSLNKITFNCHVNYIFDVNEGIVFHYNDVIMGAIVSQVTSLTIVYSSVYSDAEERKHQSFAALAFVWGIHRWPVNSPHKWPVTRKMFPFDDVFMCRLVFPQFNLQSNEFLKSYILNGLVIYCLHNK